MTSERANGIPTPDGDRELHVAFGTGQVGNAPVKRLVKMGLALRAVSQHRPLALPERFLPLQRRTSAATARWAK